MKRLRAVLIALAMVAATAPAAGPAEAPQQSSPTKVIAYYFHITHRCATCLAIERYAKEAIETGFPQQLQQGVIEWRPVNVELRENRHFVRDFNLASSSLVLVKMRDGRQRGWRNLDKVWTLVRYKNEFIKYVQNNLKNLLND